MTLRIHSAARIDSRGCLDPGNKCRDDSSGETIPVLFRFDDEAPYAFDLDVAQTLAEQLMSVRGHKRKPPTD
jgi:hypothetical protein